MDYEIKNIIKNTPYIYQYLREESYQYKYIYRDKNYLKEVSNLAKEKYKLTKKDKIERLKNNIDLIKTFMSVLD